MKKNLNDFQDDELVLDFANIKMTRKDFENWMDNYKVPIIPCSSPNRDERRFKDRDFWEVILEGSKKLSEDEELIEKMINSI